MARYILLIKGGNYEGVSPTEMGAVVEKYISWSKKLSEEGRYVSAEELKDESKILRKNGSGFALTDGPFIETKEAIGGYFVIEAATMEEAAEVAKGCPIFDANGFLEIHEVIPH